ncbi:aldolase/citrate lyase family protein [Ammoniphilus sp. 3BR4]|uniref:aldolase/citrate lyase family protein n=1 Tax=Ammoniphilus sp. 3BR4 TaxID=3158265 RepID=UPI0034660FF3
MEKLRRAMLFAPGNNPAMLQNAGIYGADAVIFDLEDAVSIPEKDSARHLVHHAIKELDYPCEVAVRINHISTPWGYEDLDTILAAKPDLIRLPKGETSEDIRIVDEIISQAEAKHGFESGSIKMMAAIENPRGLRNAFEMATASPRMVALAIGGEDFVTSLKGWKTKAGMELFVARTELLLAAREAGIYAIDSVFSDVKDDETFIAETTLIKELGFDGKSVVNPRQIELVYQIFTPTAEEIANAQKVLAAYEEALERKSGVISLNGKMIDAPMITRAERILAYSAAAREQ